MQGRLLAATVTGWLAALASFPAHAQIYRCPEGLGIALQQAPCAGLGQSGGRLMVLPNGRPAPTPVMAGASGVPRTGRALGRTPLPSPVVAQVPSPLAAPLPAPAVARLPAPAVAPLPAPVVARKSN